MSEGPATPDDGYDGPAELLDGSTVVGVEVSLRGHFEPITGSYRWYGRIAASEAVSAVLAAGRREVELRTPHGAARTMLSDVDPWGRPRVEGEGRAPFEVLTDIA